MDPDDVAYRKSVRNMGVILAVIVVTVFAAIFIPSYVSPLHNVYQSSVTLGSPAGFTMHLTLGATSMPTAGSVLITGWVNSTSPSPENITAADLWALPQNRLWGRICTSGWPIGVGVMKGHYTQDNYTLGSLIPLSEPLVSCPVQLSTPSYFLFEAHSSKALVDIAGTPAIWTIQSALSFRGYLPGNSLQPGVYTAILADEWGDVLTSNFMVA